MFSPDSRAQVRSELLDYAVRDARLGGVAITGSAAAGRQDRWSDIDLAFGVTDPGQVDAVLSDFTRHMYDRHEAVHHCDVRAGSWIYRVFFLPGTLQVDLAFVHQSEFRPLGPTFKLVFGAAGTMQLFPEPAAKDLIGMAWLHALHARSCILRGKFWQAEYMISAVRDHVLTLACIRYGLASAHGRGIDQLPESVTGPALLALVRELTAGELWRALEAAVEGLVKEVNFADPEFGSRIGPELVEVSSRPVSTGPESPETTR